MFLCFWWALSYRADMLLADSPGSNEAADTQDGHGGDEENFRAPLYFLPVRPAFYHQYGGLLRFRIGGFRMDDHVQVLTWFSSCYGFIVDKEYEGNMKGPAQNCELRLRIPFHS